MIAKVRSHLSAEQGFTMIEMMISVALLGIVLGPVVVAMIFGINYSTGTRDRVGDSSAAQLVATYFSPDVQSAQEVFTSGTGTCSAGVTGGDTVRLRLTWTDPATPTIRTTVLYFSRSSADSFELHRSECTGSDPVETTLLVLNLSSSNPLTITCDTTVGSCPSSTPSEVRMRVRAFNEFTENNQYEGFEFEVNAKRRAAA